MYFQNAEFEQLESQVLSTRGVKLMSTRGVKLMSTRTALPRLLAKPPDRGSAPAAPAAAPSSARRLRALIGGMRGGVPVPRSAAPRPWCAPAANNLSDKSEEGEIWLDGHDTRRADCSIAVSVV